MKRRKHSYAGSHPEEQYSPATRQKMFLDRPTSHGGWPEGEYDQPVRDRIYGWYKKMKMMPEGTDPSSEQRRDLQKGRYGHRLGYQQDPESQEIARDLAQRIISPREHAAALDDVMQNPHLAMNVWSELQSEGHYALARLIRPIADEYVEQRGKSMRITESQLRRIIREEVASVSEADTAVDEQAAKEAVNKFFDVKKKEFPGPASKSEDSVSVVARSTCKDRLKNAGVPVAKVAEYVKKYAPGGNDEGEAAAIARVNEARRAR
jgi:hypothetical protein